MHRDNWKIKKNKNRSQDLRKVLVSSLGQLNLLSLHNRHWLFFLKAAQAGRRPPLLFSPCTSSRFHLLR